MPGNLPFSLQGKTVLVAGASSGIGLSICHRVVSSGGRIIGVARRENLLEKMVSELGEANASFLKADLTIDAEMERVVENLPEIDGLVYAAGISRLSPVKFIKRAYLEEVMNINYFSMVMLVSQIIRKKKMKRNTHASIVLISSVAQQIGTKSSLLYTGSKGAMSAASRVIANELSVHKIRVNTIEPGMVQTDMAEDMENVLSKEAMEEDRKRYPLGYGTPDDVANAAVFLLSDASKWMTGRSLTMDGGRYKLID